MSYCAVSAAASVSGQRTKNICAICSSTSACSISKGGTVMDTGS